ncbi:26586_t:CDS:1, partial [Racocetra persica]
KYQAISEGENENNNIEKHQAISEEENQNNDPDNETLNNKAINIQLSQNIQNLPHIVRKGQLFKYHYMSSIEKE